jgi:hypothetical protein
MSYSGIIFQFEINFEAPPQQKITHQHIIGIKPHGAKLERIELSIFPDDAPAVNRRAAILQPDEQPAD